MNSIGIFSLILTAGLCSAATISETGTLSSPEDTFLVTVNLAAGGDIALQTYGFGGGINGATTKIPLADSTRSSVFSRELDPRPFF